jgi:hypothetical protein
MLQPGVVDLFFRCPVLSKAFFENLERKVWIHRILNTEFHFYYLLALILPLLFLICLAVFWCRDTHAESLATPPSIGRILVGLAKDQHSPKLQSRFSGTIGSSPACFRGAQRALRN